MHWRQSTIGGKIVQSLHRMAKLSYPCPRNNMPMASNDGMCQVAQWRDGDSPLLVSHAWLVSSVLFVYVFTRSYWCLCHLQ
jgi:hypothetical protein